MSDYAEQQLKASGVAQVIVVLKEPAEAASAAASFKKHFTQAATAPDVALANALSFAGGRRTGRAPVPPPMRVYKHLGIMFGTVDQAGLSALRSQGQLEVRSAPILSLIRPVVRAAAKAPAKTTWGIKALNVDKLWAKGITGKGVLVGHLDTGVDGRHPALKKAIKSFAEFDMRGDLVTPTPRAWDSDDHGTHTAATIAGRAVKGVSVGVAPDAKLASAMVIEGGNVIERVLGGMDWALGQGARILSMSLGFRGFVDDFEPITRILRQRNVLPVFAVGNEGPGFSRSPGNYFNALSVGASDNKMKVASFSSSQKFSRALDPNVPDLVAPGVNVSSAAPGGGYQAMDGSSMATPHIAGLAALLLQAVPSATVDQLEAAIFKSCTLPASMSADRANRGFPNAVRALSLLLPSPAGGGGGGLLPSIFPKLARAGTAKSKKAQKTARKSATKKRK